MTFNMPSKKEKIVKMNGLTSNDLYSIGKSNDLSGENLDLYVRFMKMRFPRESHGLYASEWANRFKGNPTTFMDSQSLEAYREASLYSGNLKENKKSPKSDSTTQKGDTLAVDWDTKAKIY